MKRLLLVTFIMSVAAVVALAQRTPGQRGAGAPGGAAPGEFQRGERGQRGDGFAALKNSLNLTDAQVSAIQALNKTRQERGQVIFDELRTKQQTVDSLLNATSPDPTAIGNAMLAVRASQRKLDGEREWFLTELKKQLTADQQATLDSLIAAGKRIPGLGGGPGGRGGPGPRGGRGPRPGGH
jgi:Spy/CpxP family protein refolding chaperone